MYAHFYEYDRLVTSAYKNRKKSVMQILFGDDELMLLYNYTFVKGRALFISKQTKVLWQYPAMPLRA